MSIDLPLFRPDPAAGAGRVDMDEFEYAVRPIRSRVNPELWARIWFVLFVSALAYFVQLSEIGRAAFEGSQAAYLVVAPVLAGLVAAGYSHPPRGVIDAESDWIAAALLGIGGIGAILLVQNRLPTLAALWHIDNIGLLVWVAACGTVVFSARHVLRMWNVWILGLVLAPVMPFMLMTAQLGGSDTAITVVSAVVGTTAVFLASRFVSLRLRLLATLGNLALSLAAVFLLADTGLYLTVIVAAGAVPLIVVLTLHRINWLRRDPDSVATASTLPTCKPQSYGVLAVLAIAMLCIQLPITRPAPVDVVAADWVHKSGLEPIESFDFITRFLGPDASLVRYRVPNTPESHESVVDIITTSDLARLQDFSNAVWYPSTVPVNYAPVDDGAESPAGARSAHSDADSARDENSAHWNAVTWVWHSGEVYQQVTVLTSQTAGAAPPAPRELTVDNTLIEPFLWVTRQQPTGAATVESAVGDATTAVVKSLQSEAGSDPAGTTTHAE